MANLVEEAADKAVEIAKAYGSSLVAAYGSGNGRVAAGHGLALACKDQPMSFKNAVRAELRRRGWRI